MSASGRTGWPRETRSMGNVVESDQVFPGVLGVHDDRCDPREGVDGTTVPFHRDSAPAAIADLHGIGRAFVHGDGQDGAGLNGDTASSTDLEDAEFLWMCTLARESGVRRNVQTDRDGRRTRPGTGQVERDLIAPGSLGLDDGRPDAGERVDGTAVPLGLDTPLAVIGHLHGVGRRLADADAQDRSTLLGDASCPGKME